MEVLFLAHSFPRAPGDAPGSFLLRLARALGDEGVRVRVVAPGAPGLAAFEELDGVPVHRYRYAPRRHETLAYGGNMVSLVRSSWAGRFALLGFLAAGLREAGRVRHRHAVELIHAHWWFPGGLVGAAATRSAGVPLVTTLHGSDLRIARDVRPARPPFRWVMRRSAAVTTVSHWLAAEVEALAPATGPTVAPMPVAVELFDDQGIEPAVRHPRALLFVGRLSAQKGVDRLLRALAAMHTPVTLDVVGDGAEREALQRLAGELGVAERVRWHGALPQPALADRYRRAAALVVPSREEGLGLVAVEAMLCRTPVVAFDSGGLRDVVRPGETGVLVPLDDVPALARALDDLLAPEAADRRARLGDVGRRAALDAFAPSAAARRYLGVYREALRGRAA